VSEGQTLALLSFRFERSWKALASPRGIGRRHFLLEVMMLRATSRLVATVTPQAKWLSHDHEERLLSKRTCAFPAPVGAFPSSGFDTGLQQGTWLSE